MITATWNGMETIEGIIAGRIEPETMPFAELSADEQRDIIARIDAAMEDIESVVLDKYPDLEDAEQRAARLWEYRLEFLSRTEDHLRAEYAQHFDVLHGVLIRNANVPKSYAIDSSGAVEFAA